MYQRFHHVAEHIPWTSIMLHTRYKLLEAFSMNSAKQEESERLKPICSQESKRSKHLNALGI